MPYRSFRGSRRRSMPRQVVQSFKKVMNDAAVSSAGGSTKQFTLAVGTDGVVVGQSSAVDPNVPTGCLIKAFRLQVGFQNLAAAAAANIHVSIMKLHSEQTNVVPNLVGGNSRRNQVFYQALKMIADGTAINMDMLFKVPKRFQRMREGDVWRFLWLNSDTVSYVGQCIYKFYR